MARVTKVKPKNSWVSNGGKLKRKGNNKTVDDAHKKVMWDLEKAFVRWLHGRGAAVIMFCGILLWDTSAVNMRSYMISELEDKTSRSTKHYVIGKCSAICSAYGDGLKIKNPHRVRYIYAGLRT